MQNNPYIGPRPYTRAERDKFYGRTREARDLTAKIMAERVVLFYAQSGAGKSSLLNARVLPALEEEGFHVLPVARVGSEVPPGIDPATIDNIFVFSTLLTLAGETVAPESLCHMTLTDYLQAQCTLVAHTVDEGAWTEEGGAECTLLLLLFDQFEELFTTHRDRWPEARGFFEQVRHALDTLSGLGVVFTMREDYVADMSPYEELLPRRLRARFRMERMGPDGALEAIIKPALSAGCHYAEGVAERIVDNLRRVKAVRLNAAGEPEEIYVPGPDIEPVHLQIVCNQLWENLPEQTDYVIAWDEVEKYGDIERALTDFYEGAVALAARTSGTPEYKIRAWFDTQLITPMATRGLVLRGAEETAGLPNSAVDVLEQRYLIRAETRAGARWYELCHDRLIEPVTQANAAWRRARETPLRAVARRWKEVGDESLLYRGAALAEARAWAQAQPEAAEPYEVEFLEISTRVEGARLASRRRRSIALVALGVGMILMTALAVYALFMRREARLAAESAIVGELAGRAYSVWDETGTGTLQSVRLATESMRRYPSVEAQQALVRGLSVLNPNFLYFKFESAASVVTFSPNRRWMAVGSEDGTLRVWDLATREVRLTFKHDAMVINLAFSSNSRWLITSAEDGTARVWDIEAAIAAGQPAPAEVARITGAGRMPALAFSPDAQWVAAGGDDGVLTVLATGSWDPLARLVMNPTSPVLTVAASPDSRQLVVGVQDGSILIWDVMANQSVYRLKHAPNVAVWQVAFSPDGQWLASAGNDGVARLWNAAAGVGTRWFEHEKAVWTLAFSPDSAILATGGEGGVLRSWDVKSGQLRSAVTCQGAINYLRFTPDGQWVAVASSDGLARLVDPLTGREWARNAHESAVLDLSISPDSALLASAGDDGWINVSTIRGRGMAWYSHQGEVWSVIYSRDGRWAISGGEDGVVQAWDAATGVLAGRVQHTAGVRALAFNPGPAKPWAASGGRDGLIQIWEVDTGKVLATMTHDAYVRDLVFSPDGRTLVSGSGDHTVRLWDVQTGQELMRMSHDNEVKTVAFSADGRWIASGGIDNTARVWDAATGAERWRLAHADQVWRVTFSPDGRWLASDGNDHVVRVWDMQSGVEVAQLPFMGWSDALSFSPDGKYVAVGGGEFARRSAGSGDLKVWRTADWQQLWQAPLGGWVRDAVFSADSRWLVSGGFDGAVSIWDVASGELLARIHQHGRVYAVDFSPDGRQVASAGMDQTARTWLWQPADLIAAACVSLPRNFTLMEWHQQLGAEPYQATCPNLPTPEK